MVRTQVQLREEQSETLRELATERNVSMAELVRMAVDRFLQVECRQSQAERWQRARRIFGRYSQDNKANVSEKHNEYLAEIYSAW